MLKNLYVLAWFLLTTAGFVSISTGALTPSAMFVFSLAALGLVYALALWTVIVNTREMKTE